MEYFTFNQNLRPMTITGKRSGIKLTESFRKAASSNSGRVHVVPTQNGWAVKKEGATRASSVSPTKAEALKAAHSIKSADKIVVHKKDGTIQSYNPKK